jgi:N-acetyl sugar amidotransferase
MEYCRRCAYPANARPTIILDEEGICSGCRYHESRSGIDWEERKQLFTELVNKAKEEAKAKGNIYDCIIPVSGGKDSHFQVWLLREKYGMKPLLVAYNHTFNTHAGLRNLENLVIRSGCDLIRFTTSLRTAKKLSRFMLKRIGDLTWHYHAGIMTFPIQAAVHYNIPFIFWGEEGFSELTGMFRLEDFVEFKKWTRKEHDMRGIEPEELVKDPGNDIEWSDVAPFIYPSDEAIDKLNLRGIYISNYFEWEAKRQTEIVMQEYGFAPVTYAKDRSFVQYSKIDDHANDIHDYLKFLKFGYGRATDEVSYEIRRGRMTREEGVEIVDRLDHIEPSVLDEYLKFLEMTREEFFGLVENMRDSAIWEKKDGQWEMQDSIVNHAHDDGIEAARVTQSSDRVFSEKNRQLYYNKNIPPQESGDPRLDTFDRKFKVL